MRNKTISLYVEAATTCMTTSCPWTVLRFVLEDFMTWPLHDAGQLPISAVHSFHRMRIVEMNFLIYKVAVAGMLADTHSSFTMICPHVGVLFKLL